MNSLVTQSYTNQKTLRQLLSETYGIMQSGEQVQKKRDAFTTVLGNHRYAFTHVVTIHPKSIVDVGDIIIARDALLNLIPGRHKNTNARFVGFLCMSKTGSRIARSARAFEHWRRVNEATWSYNADELQLVGPWHIHAFVGSMSADVTCEAIEERSVFHFLKHTNRYYDVQITPYDHSDKAILYFTDPERGNFLDGLYFTNDTYVFTQLERLHVHIDWCPPLKHLKGESNDTV